MKKIMFALLLMMCLTSCAKKVSTTEEMTTDASTTESITTNNTIGNTTNSTTEGTTSTATTVDNVSITATDKTIYLGDSVDYLSMFNISVNGQAVFIDDSMIDSKDVLLTIAGEYEVRLSYTYNNKEYNSTAIVVINQNAVIINKNDVTVSTGRTVDYISLFSVTINDNSFDVSKYITTNYKDEIGQYEAVLSFNYGYLEYNEKVNIIVTEIYSDLDLVYGEINKLSPNDKGTAEGRNVGIYATCYQRIDQSLLIFTDGKRIIKVHGDKAEKLWNGVSVGQTYLIYGDINLYIYQPGLTNVTKADITRVDRTPVSSIMTKQITFDDLYNRNYDDYSLFGYILEFKAYVQLDTKDSSKDVFVFSKEASCKKDTSNSRYQGIYTQNYNDLDYYNEVDSKEEITAYCFLYDYFTDTRIKYTRVYAIYDNLV